MTNADNESLLSRFAASTATAHPARLRDYLGGGKDNYDVDRVPADEILAIYPGARTAVQASRVFHREATERLAQSGVRQFLDIGAGIGPSVHLVAQREIPDARVVYVDDDPIVLCHGRAMSTPPGDTVSWFDGTLEDPKAIMGHAGKCLDFDEPVAVSLVGVIELVAGQSHALRWVRSLLAPLAAGSALVLCCATADYAPELIGDVAQLYTNQGIMYRPRSRDQFSAFFERLVLDEPGVVVPPIGKASPAEVSAYAAVGRRP